MTLELFPAPVPAPVPPFDSKPVNKSDLASTPDVRTGPVRLPPRRRFQRSSMDPKRERTRRLMRDETQRAMADAILAVLAGVEAAPFELSGEQRTWLERLLVKPCRAHRGVLDDPCPGRPECYGSIDPPAEQCDHLCPGPPDCMGAVGRFAACERSRAIPERNCERGGKPRAIAMPLSCNVPACPHDEPRRQERHRVRYQSLADLFDPRDLALGVFTQVNPVDGELARALRTNARDLGRMRRAPVITGRGPCVARREDGGPMHPCSHVDHAWRCRRKLCADQPRWRNRARRRRSRRRCALLARLGRPCDHAECRPNCPTYRHRGVVALAFFVESPRGKRGGWNLHTNFIVAMNARCDDHPRGCPTRSCAGARHFGWLAPWEELSWYWSRATCRRHRRCPGRPVCAGGAWDVHVEGYDPKKGVAEYVKYVTKPLELLDAGGPAALVEFMLARRRQKLVICAGAFYGRRFQVDAKEQRALDDETTQTLWLNATQKIRLPRRCPFGDHDADWNVDDVQYVYRADLELVGGILAYRPPPRR